MKYPITQELIDRCTEKVKRRGERQATIYPSKSPIKAINTPKQKVKVSIKKKRYRRFQTDSIDRQMDYAIANDKS